MFSGSPFSVAQTADGYLWVGTNAGLLRFDGVQFVPWEPAAAGQSLPSRLIVTLLAGKSGGLWVGTASGLAYLDHNKLTVSVKGYDFVQSIFEDPDGSVWFTHSGSATGVKEPLCHLIRAGTAKCFGDRDGIPAGDVNAAVRMAVDGHHDFWLGTGRSILRGRPGSFTRFAPPGLATGDPQGPMAIVPMTDGTAWIGIGDAGPGLGLQKLSEGQSKSLSFKGFDSSKLVVQRLLMDSHGGLWVGTANAGLYRVYGGRVDHFGIVDGLSGDQVMAVYEDREGSIWVATTNGLDRFHDLPVVTFASGQGLDAAAVSGVMAFRDGTVRVGTASSLVALRDGRVSPTETIKLPGKVVTCMLEDHAGRLWIGVDASLFFYEKGKFTSVTLPNGSPPGMVFSIAEDSKNDIWITHRGSPPGILRIRDGKVVEILAPPAFPPVRELASDLKGRLWMGPREGGLALLRNGRLERYPFDPGPDSYGARQIAITPGGFVLGALGAGLMVERDGRAQVLTVRNGLRCDSINGVVLDDKGYVWLYAECGLTSLAMQDLEKWWTQPDLIINARTLDALDGVRPGRAPFQIAARSTDGKLWFANGLTLQMFDPVSRVGNPIPPPVHIESVKADRTTYSPIENLQLPALSKELEFDYTALSFVLPQRVRFRYRLDGWDTEWQEAATRRQAFYTNMRPGTYTFHVIACNNDGLWNNAGAAIVFSILPAFYQTLWFRLMCVAAVLGAFWIVYLMRLNVITGQLQQRLGARLEERERIARDLHDTLLQGFQGLMLRFQAVMNALPALEPGRQMMEQVLDRADEVLLEGRQSVRDLRAEDAADDDLPLMLSLRAKELAQDYPIAFNLTIIGTPQILGPTVYNDIYQIAREALTNAFQHSNGTHIETEITYDRISLRVVIRDDGRGVKDEVLGHGRAGHWGLSGMRERGAKIGAKLNMRSDPGRGTEIDLMVPARVAFGRSPEASLWETIRKAIAKIGRQPPP